MSLVHRLQHLWSSASVGSPPALEHLLDEPITDNVKDLLDALRWDQQQRWKTSQPLRAEEYLAKLPGLPSGVDWMFELALGELEARRETRQPLSEEEISSRFPQLSGTLRDRQAPKSKAAPKAAGEAVPETEVRKPSELSGTFISGRGVGVGEKGRYRLDRVLGEGAFGRVYLGYDDQLHRQVAIKVPNPERFQKAGDAETYLAEARTVAALDHPSIVPVHTAERTEDGSVFIVSRYVDGGTLQDQMTGQPWDPRKAVEVLIPVAKGLHFAHQKRLIHRDVKPANILLESGSGTAYIADFGLAIREDEYLQQVATAGTPAYMSPEQARGEGHRLDGRSDVFSLGVILYELLAGERPFHGSSLADIVRAVISSDPTPPRKLRESIPSELERICLKALSKRASERYATAVEFAEDLQEWLKPAAPAMATKASVQVVPKGLRSFDAQDADFFLELLPGQRNRDGLPESIAFWKQRIEETELEQTFSVGLIYGPSGCGKSSLVKAGLLPHLSKDVVAVYLEATPDETETRILRALEKRLPELSKSQNLTDTLASLRRSRGGAKSVVIIIDQFEQWLHAHRPDPDCELVKALRQCEGGRVQAIVMVRDDFAMAAARFMDALDVPIVQWQNFRTVDLFDVDHAAKVLTKFGQAFGKLPANAGNMSADEQQFVSDVSAGLAQEDKVVSVRLSLFAEMIKGKPWTPATLEKVGGTDGIGVNFLEETFTSLQANPNHRRHAVATRGVLRALLPELGTDIKGHMRSRAELLTASGYQDRPTDFNDLLRILDGELRLITPTDPEGDSLSDDTSRNSSLATRYYQLTHDYLVPSLREWLTRKQRETKKGRAELKLAERAAVWSAKPENKQLPTLLEWFQIRRLTDKKRWTAPERSLMRTAARVHAKNWGSSILSVLILGGIIGYLFQQQSLRSQQEKITVALDSLQKTLGPAVPVNIEKLLEMQRPDLIRPDLASRFVAASEPREKLSLAFALAHFGQVEADYLISQIDEIEDRDTANLIDALGQDTTGSLEKLRQAANECGTPELQRHKARLALAALGIGDTVLPIDACEFEGRPDPGVRTWFIDEFRRWKLDLEKVTATVNDSTSPALRSAICLSVGQIPVKQISSDDKTRIAELATQWYSLPDSSTHSAVAWLMREWEIPEPTLPDATQMVDGRNWFVNSQGVTFVRITPPVVEPKPLPNPLEQVRKALTEMENATPEEKAQADFLYGRGRHLFFVGQYESALADLDAVLKMELDDSMADLRGEIEELRLFALARLKRTEEADAALAQWSASEPATVYRDYVESLVPLWLGRKEAAITRLDQGLAGAESADRGVLYNLACAVALFAASETATAEEKRKWTDRSVTLLERWIQNDDQDRIQMREDPDLIVLHGDPRFVKLAGDRSSVPEQPYWMASGEVTRGEYEAFLDDTSYEGEKPKDARQVRPDVSVSPRLDHPAQHLSWYDAVMYCNWVSKREGRTPAYRSAGKEKVQDYNNEEVEVDRWEEVDGSTGYRLPRELEWEYACRAGTTTKFSSGDDEGLLVAYCQMFPSELTATCGEKLPNARGLHDVHGNVQEWSWDLQGSDRVLRGGSWNDDAANCRTASRRTSFPTYRHTNGGFRLALSLPSVQSPEVDTVERSQ